MTDSTDSGVERHAKLNGIELANPDDIEVDEMNERNSEIETEELEKSIEQVGVVQPPLVRDLHPDSDDDGHPQYAAVVGQRRILAAQTVNESDEYEAVGEVPVAVMDWSDEEALVASITENIDLFSQDVPMSDRAEALQQMWEHLGGDGMPVQSHLAAKLGVPRETVRQWLEPLHDGWNETAIDPTTDEEPAPEVDALGERTLAEIRRMTGGGKEGERVAQLVADAGLTQEQVKEMRELVEDEDYGYEEAIEELTGGESDGDSDTPSESGPLKANIQFDSETSEAVSSYADDSDQPAATVVLEAVEWFLKAEGYLDD